MTARKDGVTKEGARRKPREYPNGRFGGRYQPVRAGTGHHLSVPETLALITEQLNDYVKPGNHTRRGAVNVILTEVIEPPDEIMLAMVRAVDELEDPSHMDVLRTMIGVYAKLQWGVDLKHGSGD